ncbi:MAG: hypothetical protein EB127_08795 [Alphaproteobacteria bacterium]|nr:hypothetical protein [Alphaproteobacteria bacterium]
MGNTASSNQLNKLAGFKKPDTCSPNNDGIFEVYRIWTTLIPVLIGIVILELLIIMFNTKAPLGTSTSITGAFRPLGI